jgi:hypothetical protein
MKRGIRSTDLWASVFELAGVGVVTVGLGKLYEPLGWVFLGVMLALIGYSLAPKADESKDRGPEHR